MCEKVIEEQASELFEVKQGVRQGCLMSLWLFTLTALVTKAEENLKHNIKALQESVRKHKLAVN